MVSQRVYSSGRLQAFLNPFTPLTDASGAKATELVNKVGGAFVQDLQQHRGGHLRGKVDYGTGEIWSGMKAKAPGLVDCIGTMETGDHTKPTQSFIALSVQSQHLLSSRLRNQGGMSQATTIKEANWRQFSFKQLNKNR